MNCYIAEQIESAPFDRARLNLPASGANTYQVQYGRKLNWVGGANQVATLRVPAGLFTSVTLQALVSELPSNAWFALDVGNTGSDSWNGTVGNGGEYTSPNLAAYFNAYWATHGAPTTGMLDVPMRVYLDRAGQVLLTNLQVTPTGSKTRYVRVGADGRPPLQTATLDFTVSGGTGPLAVGVDVGGDGSVDWRYTGSPAYPASLTAQGPDFTAAVNAYLAGKPDPTDVPLRFTLSPFATLSLTGFSATPVGGTDASIATGDITFSAPAPTEGNEVTVSATLHNRGAPDTGPLTASFSATPPGETARYIGSRFVPNVAAGSATTVPLPWNTLGFTGDTSVQVTVDPFNRVAETSEDNNQATASLTIKTRPDLHVTALTLADDKPVVGQAVTVTLTLRSDGQTAAGASVLALYDDPPTASQVLVCRNSGSVAANTTRTIPCQWTPTAPGPHRLFVRADRDQAVNESDESNNDTFREVYVGFAGPILLDSGRGATYDPAYSPENGYGYIDEGAADVTAVCGATGSPNDTLRQDPDGHLVYRFDHFQPGPGAGSSQGHFYHLDIVLRECDGAGRQETIRVDGNLIAGPVDLLDGAAHAFSILLDPALYADRAIVVAIDAPGIDGAVVSQVNVHDVDYRYADAGGDNDPQYSAATGYGWLDGVKNTGYGTLPYKSVRVDQADNTLQYRFDGLRPDTKYKLRFTFYQSAGGARIQAIEVDGIWTGLEVNSGDYLPHRETIDVPAGTYQGDGFIIVGIKRTNAATGAYVNEIALEEQTLLGLTTQILPLHAPSPNWISFNIKPPVRPALYCAGVIATAAFTSLGGDVLLADAAAPVNSLVEAFTPAGVKVGCIKVTAAGKYGYMRVYGAEGALPGMQAGEPIQLRINGIASQPTPYPVVWQNDKLTHAVSLAAPDVVPVETFLDAIKAQVVKLQSEAGTYLPPPADPRFNTATTVAAGQGYLLYTQATGTLSVTGERVLSDTPLALHAGWNWLGYLPTCELPIPTALAGIAGKYDLLNGETGTYRPPPADPAHNTLSSLRPGQGYMIHMTQATTLVYPTAGCGLAANTTPADDATLTGCRALPTGIFTHYYGRAVAANGPLPAGAVILAYSPRGEVAGCGQVKEAGLYPYLRVYGAEGDLPGLLAGEPVRFTVNGRLVLPSDAALWQNDWDVHPLDLTFDGVQYQYLPVIVR